MEGRGRGIARRAFLAGTASALASGCHPARDIPGGFAGGASFDRGHLLREAHTSSAPARTHRVRVVIAGAGIAGLAASRALRLRGIEDFAVLDLEDDPGGNSRAGAVNGIACPWGAHYLPVPGDDSPEVQDFLEELGLRRRVAGRWEYEELHLVHAPQERLWFRGRWQDGVVPLDAVGNATIAQYRRFAQLVEDARRVHRFAIPMAVRDDTRAATELDAMTFARWLDRQRLDDAQLRWLLDYCCRDDYGAGIDTVSAWAGIHYFAARHGFHPLAADDAEREGLLTWPEGNAFFARTLAASLKERFHGGCVVVRIAAMRRGVEVDALDVRTGRIDRWQADHCIVALPVFIAARVIVNAPVFLQRKAAAMRYAPWVVANLHLRALPDDRAGAEIAWDNVVYGTAGLGYVVATHQKLDPRPGPTVFSWYCAPGESKRREVLDSSWQHWRDAALAELSAPHPDLAAKVTRVEVARYGHAMSIPVPGSLALSGMPAVTKPLSFAHADWAGYSIFEEAFTMGHRAGAIALMQV
ncbi:MAG TPA: NAD(P)-binding protein [Ramlibacter sp.]|nr:NAD(P)-binding protein [Ramlibacter sp.]HVZ46972.1 NAD(P)-binding protein [Ramlibacter sp.]